MNEAWKNDPRLKKMDKKKLELLQSLAKELEQAPREQKMAAFFSVNQKAAREHISFQADEREILFSILTEGMSAGERQKADAIRKLAEKMKR